MVEVARTDDPVRLSYWRAVLNETGVAFTVFDAGAGGLWPGAFQARVMVAPQDAWMARKAIEAAEV